MSKISALDLIRTPHRLTLGIELPLDNDWSPEGEARRLADGRPRGVPDLSVQSNLVRKIDSLGFAALWVRDVPVFDAVNMGDAGSVYMFSPFWAFSRVSPRTSRSALPPWSCPSAIR